jgi:hypothetical protein
MNRRLTDQLAYGVICAVTLSLGRGHPRASQSSFWLTRAIGKPLEYNQAKIEDWSARPHLAGWPVTRHPVHGWHVCLHVGLPENIAHIAAAHSREGDTIVRSMECTVIQACDHALWQVLRLGGLIKDGPPRYHPNPAARD